MINFKFFLYEEWSWDFILDLLISYVFMFLVWKGFGGCLI